jgi:hypothetical protein
MFAVGAEYECEYELLGRSMSVSMRELYRNKDGYLGISK